MCTISLRAGTKKETVVSHTVARASSSSTQRRWLDHLQKSRGSHSVPASTARIHPSDHRFARFTAS
jgi:hypothetical protein